MACVNRQSPQVNQVHITQATVLASNAYMYIIYFLLRLRRFFRFVASAHLPSDDLYLFCISFADHATVKASSKLHSKLNRNNKTTEISLVTKH